MAVDQLTISDEQLLDKLGTARERLLREIRKAIIGQDEVVEQVLLALFEWPPTNNASSTCSTTSSCPMMAFLISRRRRSRAVPSLSSSCSSLIVNWSTAIVFVLCTWYLELRFLCFDSSCR